MNSVVVPVGLRWDGSKISQNSRVQVKFSRLQLSSQRRPPLKRSPNLVVALLPGAKQLLSRC